MGIIFFFFCILYRFCYIIHKLGITEINILLMKKVDFKTHSAICVRTPTVNMNTFSTTVKDEILEGW